MLGVAGDESDRTPLPIGAVADEVSQQPTQLGALGSLRTMFGESHRRRDKILVAELLESSPALWREKRVIPRRPNDAAALRRHSVDGFPTGTPHVGDLEHSSPLFAIDGDDPRA